MRIVRHFIQMIVAILAVVVCMIYPFLPGPYDVLAVPLSTMLQLFGAAGLLLVPVGILWLVFELRKQARRKRNLPAIDRGYFFATSSLISASVLAILVSLLSLNISIAMAVLALALWFFAVSRSLSKLNSLKTAEVEGINPAPMYLIVIPLAMLLFQVMFAARLTEFSRNLAIANSSEFIRDIETYREKYGYYPVSL